MCVVRERERERGRERERERERQRQRQRQRQRPRERERERDTYSPQLGCAKHLRYCGAAPLAMLALLAPAHLAAPTLMTSSAWRGAISGKSRY